MSGEAEKNQKVTHRKKKRPAAKKTETGRQRRRQTQKRDRTECEGDQRRSTRTTEVKAKIQTDGE